MYSGPLKALVPVGPWPHDGGMDAAVIATRGLTKCYGHTPALEGLELTVPAGVVFGFLGPNGAGKSTTIRVLMGLIRPSAGSATVLGHDVVRERRVIHGLVGYLPGDFTAYNDLTGIEYLTYLSNLRGDVDPTEAQLLAKRFEVDLDRRIGTLSHGNRQKVGIIQACMHRPDLLILDEPTSGLDPLMQHQFIGLVRDVRDRGGTVFLSSHVLTEVEAVADLVGVIRQGRLVMTSGLADLKARTRRRVEFTFNAGTPLPTVELRNVPSVRALEVEGAKVRLVVEGSMAELMRVAAPYGIERVVSNELDLEEVLLHYYEAEGQ